MNKPIKISPDFPPFVVPLIIWLVFMSAIESDAGNKNCKK